MIMEEQVLSIKQMQKLKELGIDISKASMCWIGCSDGNDVYPYNSTFKDIFEGHKETIPTVLTPAFTLPDILNILPDIIVNKAWYIPLLYKSGDMWVVDYHRAADFNKTFLPNGIDIMCCCETALEAAFNMLIWCKEENYI